MTTLLLPLLLALSPAPKATVPAAAPPVPSAVTAYVRIRKLHLVRPDLILYPLAYEVYC